MHAVARNALVKSSVQGMSDTPGRTEGALYQRKEGRGM